MAKQTSSIQYSIMDIYVVLALVMTGLLLAPLIMQGNSHRTVKAIAVIIVTVFAGLIAFWRAHARNLSGLERVLCLAWYVLLSWGVGLILFNNGWFGPCAICVMSLPGVVVGLRRARTKKYTGHERNSCVVLTTIGSLILIMLLGELLTPNLSGRGRGSHESTPVEVCKSYAEAQEIYRRTDWDGDGVLEYSAAISGAYSLFETISGSGDVSLVDAAFAKAGAVNNEYGASPKVGYFFRILHRSGPASPDGQKSFFDKDGNMTTGNALIAWPAAYGETGKRSFMISNEGTVYQKDLGPETTNIVALMTEYNPDSSWDVAE